MLIYSTPGIANDNNSAAEEGNDSLIAKTVSPRDPKFLQGLASLLYLQSPVKSAISESASPSRSPASSLELSSSSGPTCRDSSRLAEYFVASSWRLCGSTSYSDIDSPWRKFTGTSGTLWLANSTPSFELFYLNGPRPQFNLPAPCQNCKGTETTYRNFCQPLKNGYRQWRRDSCQSCSHTVARINYTVRYGREYAKEAK